MLSLQKPRLLFFHTSGQRQHTFCLLLFVFFVWKQKAYTVELTTAVFWFEVDSFTLCWGQIKCL